jgi:hypothetical protein
MVKAMRQATGLTKADYGVAKMLHFRGFPPFFRAFGGAAKQPSSPNAGLTICKP